MRKIAVHNSATGGGDDVRGMADTGSLETEVQIVKNVPKIAKIAVFSEEP